MSATMSYTASVQSSMRKALLTYRYSQYDAGMANLGDFIAIACGATVLSES